MPRRSAGSGAGAGAGAAHAAAGRAQKTRERADPRLLAALVLATMAYSQLQAMVGPAVPTLQRELHADTSELAWMMNSFILSAAVATPLAGRLGDMFGHRRVLLAVLGLLAAGTALCGLATTLPTLVVGRVIAGLGGAVFPLSFAIVRDAFPSAKVAATIGLLSALTGVGGGVGIVAAGPIVTHMSYHWLFWFPLVLIVAALAAAVAWVPRSAPGEPGPVDWIGAVLLSGTLVSLLLALTKAGQWGWGSAGVSGLLAASVVFGLCWAAAAGRSPAPLIDLGTMRLRAVWTANAAAVLSGVTMSTSMFLLPQLAALPESTRFGMGLSATKAGLFILPQSFTILVAGVVGGRVGARYGSRLVLAGGTALAAGGMGMLGLWHAAVWQALVASAVVGFGVGLLQTALANVVVAAVPPTQTAAATGANTVARNIGMTLGAQQAATVLATGSHGIPGPTQFAVACGIAVGAGTLATAISLLAPGRQKDTVPGRAAPVDAAS
ncbi:MFS transporter [Streptodolium elevatio]|uniref:MFS transporter n=1 Tax=Streptodolium elevatio TaxID=3157996 RepID=A0ABV3D901_9ACTN